MIEGNGRRVGRRVISGSRWRSSSYYGSARTRELHAAECSYDPTRELYEDTKAFAAYWKSKTGDA